MKVLVCGGAGYIGSHVTKALLGEGFDVVIFDNFSSGKEQLVRGGKVVRGDLEDKVQIGRVFQDHRFEAVLHFASLIQVGESFLNPQRYYTHNLSTSLNLFEAMLQAGVQKVIFSSSAAVYGIPQETPITETHPLKPINPYGHTKLFVERILEDYDKAYGLKHISLRYFNAAGADPDGRLGEMHDPETHLIPNLLLSLLGKKPAFELYGTKFPTPDGTAVRDYIHVTDLAGAHVLALRRLLSSGQSDAINLGASRGFSVLEVLRKAEEVTGGKVEYRVKSERLGDVAVLLASKEKAEKTLGWKLHHSDLEQIIETAWRWHRGAVQKTG
jgi:UDP-glucose 4-epimerase